jgi:hypothetical protein
MGVIEKTESTVEVASVLGILLLLYYAYGQLKKTTANLFQDSGATVTGTAPWVATTTPLTPAHADSLAKFLGVDLHGGSWQLSPDKTQIWFADGYFFDNATGHFFDKAGNDQGDLLGAAGSGGQVTGSAEDAATLDLTAPLAG